MRPETTDDKEVTPDLTASYCEGNGESSRVFLYLQRTIYSECYSKCNINHTQISQGKNARVTDPECQKDKKRTFYSAVNMKVKYESVLVLLSGTLLRMRHILYGFFNKK